MRRITRALLLLGVIALARSWAAAEPKAAATVLAHPSYAQVSDGAGLPRVLLIGDSISMGYTLEVRAHLAGVATVHRPAANCNSTGFGLTHLAKWLGDGHWDVIHFNFGLHDAKLPPEGKLHAPPEVYRRNLTELVRRLKATGANLIWASSTPIPLGGILAPDRRFGDIDVYNEIANEVMAANGVQVNDLNGAVAPHVARLQIAGDVHFTQAGSSLLAAHTATAMARALSRNSQRP
jgi:GDSL-like Lipase/Acylhydrolase family